MLKLSRLILSIISLVLVAMVIDAHVKALETRNWPYIEGYVEYIYERRFVSAPKGTGPKRYFVKYEYLVDGNKYIGKKIAILASISIPYRKLKNLKNKKVRIFYNPNSPAESILFNDYPYTAISLLLIIIFFTTLLFVYTRNILSWLSSKLINL